jgi:16S rRNA (adenine1518-N6/adenine1519-N6)-dimethyltransferase
MVQKEVAQRICAKPPKMNLLAISVQFYSEPKIVSFVQKNCFWPKPKVDSAIIKIEPKERELIDPKLFFKMIKAGFSYPRKQLINNLSRKLKIEKEKVKNCLLKANILPEKRPEALDIEDWIKLVKIFSNKNR